MDGYNGDEISDSEWEGAEVSMEMKACPFCGSEARIIERDGYDGKAYDVGCTNSDCYLYHGADWYLAKSIAIEAWNARPTPAAGEAKRPDGKAFSLLYEACREFVRKVECGEARSKRSYAQMKEAIAVADAKAALEGSEWKDAPDGEGEYDILVSRVRLSEYHGFTLYSNDCVLHNLGDLRDIKGALWRKREGK